MYTRYFPRRSRLLVWLLIELSLFLEKLRFWLAGTGRKFDLAFVPPLEMGVL
jgi:hypothetical protein